MSGQPEVEEDEVVSGRRQGVGPGGDVGDLVAVCPQARHERLGDRPVVFDEQQLHPHIVEDSPAAGETVGRICEVVGRFLDVGRPPRRTTAPYRRRGRRQDKMKAPSARVAMLLSIGGVLAAGSAAAVVNSQVLDDQSAGAPASATAVSTTTLAAVTTTTARADDALDHTATTTVATAPATVATDCATPSTAATDRRTVAAARLPRDDGAPPAATQATYRLGDAGTALLDTAGGRLTVVSVTPLPDGRSTAPNPTEPASRSGWSRSPARSASRPASSAASCGCRWTPTTTAAARAAATAGGRRQQRRAAAAATAARVAAATTTADRGRAMTEPAGA